MPRLISTESAHNWRSDPSEPLPTRRAMRPRHFRLLVVPAGSPHLVAICKIQQGHSRLVLSRGPRSWDACRLCPVGKDKDSALPRDDLDGRCGRLQQGRLLGTRLRRSNTGRSGFSTQRPLLEIRSITAIKGSTPANSIRFTATNQLHGILHRRHRSPPVSGSHTLAHSTDGAQGIPQAGSAGIFSETLLAHLFWFPTIHHQLAGGAGRWGEGEARCCGC